MARAISAPPLRWPARGLIVHIGVHQQIAEDNWLDWLEYDGARVLAEGRSRLAELPPARVLVLLLSAEDVLLTRAPVPPLSGQRLREALPYLVEEQTLAEPSALHVALGRALGDQRVLAVVDRNWLRNLIEGFSAAGHRVAEVVPEALCVPLLPPAWTLVRETDTAHGDSAAPWSRSWVRQDIDVALALPADVESARVTLRLLLAQVPETEQPVHIDGYGDVGIFDHEQARVRALPGRALHAWLAQGGPADPVRAPPTLLQHEFANRGSGAGALRNWQRIGVLALLLAMVQIGGMHLYWYQLRSEQARLQDEAAAALQTVFPEITVVLDAPLQMARGLTQLRAATGRADPGDFTSMGAAAGRIFIDTPTASVRTLDYADRSMRLQFTPDAMRAATDQAVAIENAGQGGYALRFEAAGTGSAGAIAILRTRNSS